MKILLETKFIFFLTLSFISFFSTIKISQAWDGYDYENKTEIEIGPGNLVRESLVIQFYDTKADNFHTGKIIYMDSVAGGTRIQLQDLDLKKERIFIMLD